MKDEVENKKTFQTNDINEPEIPETREIKADNLLPAQEMKMEFSGNQENSDAVEDCINLNVEDEENFEEVSVQTVATCLFCGCIIASYLCGFIVFIGGKSC